MTKTISLNVEEKPTKGKYGALSEFIDVDDLHIDMRNVKQVDGVGSGKDIKYADGSSQHSVRSPRNVEVVPSLLTHPFRSATHPIIPDLKNHLRPPKGTYMPPALVAYFERLRDQKVEFNNDDTDGKLVIPSIKRDLVFRSQQGIHARPFLHAFMTYLLEPSGDDSQPTASKKDFVVFLWSTAMRKTLLPMLDAYFNGWHGEILGVWSREDLGLKEESFHENPDTFKDLEQLFKHLQDQESLSPARQHLLGDFIANLDNTVLVEENASKCRLQPLNFVPIPEYSDKEYENSVIAAHGGFRKRDLQSDITGVKRESARDERIDERAALLRKIFGCEASTFYERHAAVDTAPDQSDDESLFKLDAYLVVLIGILSELLDVVSVPVWIAAGGLTPDIDHTFTEDMASGGWGYVGQIDAGLIDIPLPGHESNKAAIPSQSPSHSGGGEWFESPFLVLYWLRRGFLALDEKRIVPDYGLGRRRTAPLAGIDL